MKLGSISDIWKKKPTSNQKWLLGVGLVGTVGVLIYYKFFYNTTATTSTTASFTGDSPYANAIGKAGMGADSSMTMKHCAQLLAEYNNYMVAWNRIPSDKKIASNPHALHLYNKIMAIKGQIQSLGCKFSGTTVEVPLFACNVGVPVVGVPTVGVPVVGTPPSSPSPSSPTPVTPLPIPFTGAYDCYNSYLSADGRNGKTCKDLSDALMLIRTAFEENERNHGRNLKPAEITMFKAQEMKILSEMQKYGCR